MTYTDQDRRMGKLQDRVSDIEQGHGGSIYQLTRDVRRHELITRRLAAHSNALGQGIAMIMERLALPAITIPEVDMPTEDEVDASFEDEF